MNKEIQKFNSADDFKKVLANTYMTQIKNFFGDDKNALRFLSGVMASVQKTPDLLDCEPTSVINSFMTMAQLGLMPSDVSGEAYVLPYKTKHGEIAQFQLGYQGLLTLFYRAGVKSIRAEIVREKDKFSYVNGKIYHEIDIFKSNKDRGKAIGAYAIGLLNGQEVAKLMNRDDILNMGKKFSKSYNSTYTAWNEEKDPELWMWKKTVLKQLGKLLPKNETIYKAIDADNEDSDLMKPQKNMIEDSGLQMGNLLKEDKTKTHENQKANKEEDECPIIEQDSEGNEIGYTGKE